MEDPRCLSGEPKVNEMLRVLAERERVYYKAKNELNDIQKKLDGILYDEINGNFKANEVLKRKLILKNSQQKDSPIIKRGRGRPKKNREVHMICHDDNEDVTVTTPGTTNTSDYISSCDTCLAEDDSCQDQDEYQVGRFKGAMYKYINDGLYIENRDGKCYDIHTLELRGWYNPYLLTYKWL